MKGDATVVANLFSAASLEAHLVEQYRVDYIAVGEIGVKFLKEFFCDLYEDSECYLKKLVKRLIYFDQNPKYNSDEVAGPSDIGGLLNDTLALESAVVEKYQGFCKQAWDVLDDNTRNMYEHLIKWHEKSIAKIEKEIALFQDLGPEGYKEARLES